MTSKNMYTVQQLVPQRQMQTLVQDGGTGTGGVEGETTVTDPVVTPPTPPAPTPRFTEDDIEKARQQEKDKLYPRLEKLQEQLDVFMKEREEAQRLAAEKAAAEAEERRKREEAELDAKQLIAVKEDEWNQRLNTAQQEWEQKFQALEQEREQAAALLELERTYQALESFKNRRIAEEQENIVPELVRFITGDSEEAIEASIQAAIESSSAIIQSIQQSLPQTQQRVKGVPATGQAPSGPLENMQDYQKITIGDLKNMPIEEYAKLRVQLGIGRS